ncbi:hypothetical protein BpHYR1_009134 [Brachionus plicatilis]|uniref:Uncharacterized protein n=1 Tax=Brachionus plicatilis TaxID=10195 RepID=A0A3M7SFL6_BRAPC|nr:hypothetical protein BpHYR1_009134 [Brachionus plicatilis]
MTPVDLKTPVLENHLVSRLNDFLPLCQSPVNVRSNDQNETETFFKPKIKLRDFPNLIQMKRVH